MICFESVADLAATRSKQLEQTLPVPLKPVMSVRSIRSPYWHPEHLAVAQTWQQNISALSQQLEKCGIVSIFLCVVFLTRTIILETVKENKSFFNYSGIIFVRFLGYNAHWY